MYQKSLRTGQTQMDKLVRKALKIDLIERYGPIDVWNEDDSNRTFRLVFELAPEDVKQIRFPRAVRYIDVRVAGGNINVWSHKNKGITVDYNFPDSIDKLDEFITENCRPPRQPCCR